MARTSDTSQLEQQALFPVPSEREVWLTRIERYLYSAGVLLGGIRDTTPQMGAPTSQALYDLVGMFSNPAAALEVLDIAAKAHAVTWDDNLRLQKRAFLKYLDAVGRPLVERTLAQEFTEPELERVGVAQRLSFDRFWEVYTEEGTVARLALEWTLNDLLTVQEPGARANTRS